MHRLFFKRKAISMSCQDPNCKHWIDEYNKVQNWLVDKGLWEKYKEETSNDQPERNEQGK